ncbi:MAG TPA: DUF6597 domain-containing transcriptional factor [Pseudonocardiaceae bacterium]|jgi:AraC-like DNA-binding protein
MAVSYRELPPPADLRAVVACLWEQESSAPWPQLVVPDGCVDLIWFGDGDLVVAGPDTGPRTVLLPAGSPVTGIRLRPGAAGAFARQPAAGLRDQDVDALELLGSDGTRLVDRLAAAPAAGRLDLLAGAVRGRHVAPDPLVTAAARILDRPGARVASVADTLGVSERQLHRRTVEAVGYPPKLLARILRLRRLARGYGPLADRALDAGYATQSHMNDEVRALTGTTATRYLAGFGGV